MSTVDSRIEKYEVPKNRRHPFSEHCHVNHSHLLDNACLVSTAQTEHIRRNKWTLSLCLYHADNVGGGSRVMLGSSQLFLSCRRIIIVLYTQCYFAY